ncbi:Protein OPY2 [Diplodia seriata]|uniref:Protein OPY2 n=1 Tax=Diplodia seriata TaxID=420778 RepID=A0A1S8B659_9PEZI|nr:Protein OPY2 [Diplodia seriata]
MASNKGLYPASATLVPALPADDPTAIEHTLRTIFRRCYQCPDETPSCPTCSDGEYCSQLLSSCTQCASAVCVKMDGSPGTEKKSGGTNVGAIAGGVVGGVAVLLILTFLVWKFYYKGKRRQYDESDHWSHMDVEQEKGANDFTMRRDARASTHTVASMASTVLTRASNIIQIAYIPGVTNRSGAPSPGTLVPPVPPIPSAHSGTASPYSEQHFFVPGDLRDSTYSGLSAGRSSISPSLARSSVATTIYRNNAVISPLPAQTIVRGKAAVVSVKSNSSGSPSETPGSETPPVPSINYDQLEKDGRSPKGGFKIQMPHSSDKAGVSPQGSVKSVQIGKPKALTITKGKKSKTSLANEVSMAAASSSSEDSGSREKSPTADRIPIKMRPLTEVSITDSAASGPEFKSHMDDDSSDDEGYDSRARNSNVTDIQDTPGMTQSPFADSNRAENLETVIEEATKRASKDVTGGLGNARARSPFGDENALKE